MFFFQILLIIAAAFGVHWLPFHIYTIGESKGHTVITAHTNDRFQTHFVLYLFIIKQYAEFYKL